MDSDGTDHGDAEDEDQRSGECGEREGGGVSATCSLGCHAGPAGGELYHFCPGLFMVKCQAIQLTTDFFFLFLICLSGVQPNKP